MVMRTYQTRIVIDESASAILSSYARLFAKVLHHLFKAKTLNMDPNICKRDFLKKFGITGRQYNACKVAIDGKIDSIKERRDLQIEETQEKIKALETKIKKIRNPLTSHQNKRRLSHFKIKLEQLKIDKAQNKLSLCFGSKKLFYAQFSLKENSFSSHDE